MPIQCVNDNNNAHQRNREKNTPELQMLKNRKKHTQPQENRLDRSAIKAINWMEYLRHFQFASFKLCNLMKWIATKRHTVITLMLSCRKCNGICLISAIKTKSKEQRKKNEKKNAREKNWTKSKVFCWCNKRHCGAERRWNVHQII